MSMHSLIERNFRSLTLITVANNPRMFPLNTLQFYLLPLIPQRMYRLTNALNLHINYCIVN